jgi:hypothetical protein
MTRKPSKSSGKIGQSALLTYGLHWTPPSVVGDKCNSRLKVPSFSLTLRTTGWITLRTLAGTGKLAIGRLYANGSSTSFGSKGCNT